MDPHSESEYHKFHHIKQVDQHEKKPQPLTSKEKKGILLLLILYTIQGFPIGFFGGAVQLLLTEAGISMTKLAELSVVLYPFTFKFLFAPFQDAHYFKSFGKRKSYIIPIQYLMAILFFVVSLSIDDLLKNQEISSLIIFGFIAIFLSSQQDIAVDGWVLTIFENEEHVNIGSTCNTIGQLLGVLITNSFFIQINSVEFCNKFLYSTPSDKPLVTTKQFLQIISAIIAVVTVFVHFFVQEREKSDKQEIEKVNDQNKNSKLANEETSEQQQEQIDSVIDVIKKLRGFFTNKNLRFLIIFMLSQNIGNSPVFASFTVLLVRQGLSKEIISTISTIIIPFNFIAAILSSKLIRPSKEMNAWRNAFVIQIVVALIGYAIIILNPVIDESQNKQMFILVLIFQILVIFVSTFKFIAQGGFFNRISDEDVGGSSLTTLNSFSNLGGQFSEQIALVALSYLSFTQVVFIGLTYSLLYLFFMHKKILSQQLIPKNQWRLEKLQPKKQQ
ncbi:acetyl-coenzyme A transporter 1 (macronuclear) [Tetrahymena thermophila SB210]|uniref:Acetyl-coenzyme A transporter 1 n=1 Tax=Tetrahymena thermophila (strain SB210) TaxID=312017 RepID=Q22PN8_TETTS|nr:acetyl-coenzyme A transporter 1 [Tetrahymena thermophila SB210]EAR87251.1 acetyl-coenzyme A transporter 1 [Tetrahymena thermophila SB210]|eukprot:XP_001007496.1 acetyl-coenzyme A transporter 1 [Tetrahymena thermophila SB210]